MIHDFSALYDTYPDVIAHMPDVFTSHEFILQLARRRQRLYVEALYSYRNSLHSGEPAPFQVVHAFLSKHLRTHPDLVTYLGEVPSEDIFRQPSKCAQWRRC